MDFIQSSHELNRAIINKAKERNLDLKIGKVTSDVFTVIFIVMMKIDLERKFS